MRNIGQQLRTYDANDVGLRNGHLFGLPFDKAHSEVIILPIPWDVTASYGRGTAEAFKTILEASIQLDLYDVDDGQPWKRGIFLHAPISGQLASNGRYGQYAQRVIHFLENGGRIVEDEQMQKDIDEVNRACEQMIEQVYELSQALLNQGKQVGILGGDHSVSLPYMRALADYMGSYGVLQIDAHADLRESYQGFTYSHASIMHHVLKDSRISKLVQVGVRDICQQEVEVIERAGNRIQCFYDRKLKEAQYQGITWDVICTQIVEVLPVRVYVSFDIDGLDPKLCPHTGTPVCGGLDVDKVFYLFKKIIEQGKTIIGFDLCEVGNHVWDANVASRILYRLSAIINKK